MSTQNIDFAQTGPTLDTGEKEAAAIRPIANGEPATQAVFQRPDENLRVRTETLRTELEALKYLTDADRALVAAGGGSLLWNGIVAGGGNGKFTTGVDLSLRPFLAPATSTKAKALIRGVSFETILIQAGAVVPPRAYSGANKISVQLQGSNGAVLAVAISGTPGDNVLITVNTHPTSGTTKQQLIDWLTGVTDAGAALAYRNLGLTAALGVGAVGTDKVNSTGTWLPTDYLLLAGAADAEKHIITPSGLSTFFTDPLNVLAEGDVLCIWYDTLVNGLQGGRRESITDLPENSANVDANLFLLRRFPERLPLALPVATVISDTIRLIDGSILQKGLVTTLTGGLPGLPPPTSEPPAQFLRMSPGGAHYWAPVTTDIITSVLSIPSFAGTTPGPGPSAANGVYEIGQTVATPSFSATTTSDGANGPTNATLTNNDNAESKNVVAGFANTSSGSFTSSLSYVKNSAVANGAVVFTLTANDGNTPATKTAQLNWYRRVYWGFSPTDPGTYNDTFVKATVGGGGTPTARSLLRSAKSLSIVLAAPGTPSFVFFAYPARHGNTFTVFDNIFNGDATGAFTLVGTALAVTTENGAAVAETYNVVRSNQLQSNAVNITVS